MAEYDYVIVGSGPAGSVITHRLTEDPNVTVALVEAGPPDTHPFIHMPKGLIKVMADPQHLWVYACTPGEGTGMKPDAWVRGRVLGGSSSINGMMYVRGQPADYDAIAEMSSDDWSWKHIGPAYEALEHHELGAGETRGARGPLNVSVPDFRSPLTDAMVTAGGEMGWPIKRDVNQPDNDQGIGYAPRTIYKGKRQSAAVAFLRPIMGRKNLTVLTNHVVDTVAFEGKTAVGVNVIHDGQRSTVRAKREVILCGGAMSSPGILERSGIGQAAVLEKLGIKVLHESPLVGEKLSEHRSLIMQWKVRDPAMSQNREFSGWRLLLQTLRYYLRGDGPMSAAAFEIGAWFKSRPGANRPDAQLLIAPYSFDFDKDRQALETHPGMAGVIYPLRPSSMGHVHITSTDPNAPPEVEPNYRATEEDRRIMVDSVRVMREYAKQDAFKRFGVEETMPGPAFQTDEEILAAYDKWGMCGYHAVGSCSLGKAPDSVVDPELRVRGVERLRVMDTSIMPVIPSGNTNGPTMAMAWRAADIIKRGAAALA